MHDEVSETENIRKNLAIESMIEEGCDILLDVNQMFVRQGNLHNVIMWINNNTLRMLSVGLNLYVRQGNLQYVNNTLRMLSVGLNEQCFSIFHHKFMFKFTFYIFPLRTVNSGSERQRVSNIKTPSRLLWNKRSRQKTGNCISGENIFCFGLCFYVFVFAQ